jgi:hypothetical protein
MRSRSTAPERLTRTGATAGRRRKRVLFSIDPDAHSTREYAYVSLGVGSPGRGGSPRGDARRRADELEAGLVKRRGALAHGVGPRPGGGEALPPRLRHGASFLHGATPVILRKAKRPGSPRPSRVILLR